MSKFRFALLGVVWCLVLLGVSAQKNRTFKVLPMAKAHPKVCGDVRITLFDLRRGVDFHSFSLCEIILGSITYAPMNSISNISNTSSSPIRFPYLREVYGYILLGYSSMRSFSSMFPRLSVVHGRDLYHGYALVIMDNFVLDELGFTSLISIRRGSVIIARNAQLCYATSIRWFDILETKKTQVVSRQNRDNCAFCPTCPSACWSPTQCQQRCSAQCKGNCLSETICCPEQCVGGCYYGNGSKSSSLTCSACRNMRIYATGKCVESCPSNMLKVSGSLCVTPVECPSFFLGSGFVLNETNECVRSCPDGFTQMPSFRCERCDSSPANNYCNNACREKHIRSISDFASLKYCSRVHTLNIYNIATVESRENVFAEALTAFEALTQIDQEFTIHNVKVFSSLAVFSRLKRIGLSANATITIEENDLLTKLWPLSQPPPIIQGSLNIVRNARLCPKHVFELVNYTMSIEKDLQVTPNTKNEYANGYLASCESNFLSINIDRIRSRTARANAAVPKELFLRSGGKSDNLRRPFISVYYKSTKTKNETHFDATQSQKWSRVVEKASYNPAPHIDSFMVSAELSPLMGDEWYAVYGSLTSNANTVGLFSPIIYFRTLPRQPEPVLNLRAETTSRSTIELTWQPPTKPNGPIATYLIYYAAVEDRLPMNNSRLLCLMKDRWDSEVIMPMNNFNLNSSTRCARPRSKSDSVINTGDDDLDDEGNQNTDIDQVVTDLSILEYQLINSVSQRKEPLDIRPETKDTIITQLDQYIEDKSDSSGDQYKPESAEQPIAEHEPHINEHNRSVSTTRVMIEGLKQAQLYMFQVYACHNTSQQTLSQACSLNGIILAARTKPGDPSQDLVQNVQVIAPMDHSELSTSALVYRITWFAPFKPNGLIYFYLIFVGQDSNTGPKEERCVGHDVHAINVTLLPRTAYRLRIITYTIARLNNEYGDKERLHDEHPSTNSTNLFYEFVFTTKDVPNIDAVTQNRFMILALIFGSIVLLLIIILGAPFYYYKYGRGDTKASISKNPNYELYTPDKWEIDKDSVALDRLIGQGHFGQVYHGTLRLPDGTTKSCAVKLRTTHPTDLLQEASIMKQFQCDHVIQLYGICSRIRPPYVVMELMENGDLKSYLYRHRQSEVNPAAPTLSEAAMIQLALDVADGMYYLADQKFVHRDLAARNCLVNGNHTCKVGDFGLTRDIYETDYYRRGGPNFLPIRWMAPESLRDGRFDTVSDVWSFGVLLWEIATLAEQPYQGYGNEEVVHYVRYGNITLERPSNCPEILHKLMRACWTYSPTDRISFRSIVDELVPYESDDFHLHAYYHTQPHPPVSTVTHDGTRDDEEELLLADHENEEDDDDNDDGHIPRHD